MAGNGRAMIPQEGIQQPLLACEDNRREVALQRPGYQHFGEGAGRGDQSGDPAAMATAIAAPVEGLVRQDRAGRRGRILHDRTIGEAGQRSQKGGFGNVATRKREIERMVSGFPGPVTKLAPEGRGNAEALRQQKAGLSGSGMKPGEGKGHREGTE
jgi:hypothetical protein